MKTAVTILGLVIATISASSCGNAKKSRSDNVDARHHAAHKELPSETPPIIVEHKIKGDDGASSQAPISPAVVAGVIAPPAVDPVDDFAIPVPPPLIPVPVPVVDDFDDDFDDDDDPACGNGTVEAGEECDDGNTTPGDGCDENCEQSCVGYAASLKGSGTSASTAAGGQGQITVGLFEIGFNRPLDVERTTCNEVSGAIDTRSTFPTNPECQDINDPNCPTAQTRTFTRAKCLEVDDNTAWFSATIIAKDPDPRLDDASNAQTALNIQLGKAVLFGRIVDDTPDSRSLFTTGTLVFIEGIDNAVGPIGSTGTTSTIVNQAYTVEEFCSFKDDMFAGNADYIINCVDNLQICAATGNPSCTQPTVADNGIGFALDGSWDCFVNNTTIQWLDADTANPLPGDFPNTVLTLSNPPAAAIYDLAGVTRTITSGNFIVTRTPPN